MTLENSTDSELDICYLTIIIPIISLFLESSPDPQCGAIIEKYKDRFLSCIDCAIVTRLEIEKVIPDTVSHKIQQSAPSVANEVLFLHLRSHSSPETLYKLCDVMISMSGYPKMNELGRSMTVALTTVSYVAESYEYMSQASPRLCGIS